VRKSLANNYRARISNFLEEMVHSPIKENDYYKPSPVKLNNLKKFKGPDYMVYNAPRCDEDIKKQFRRLITDDIDTCPAKP